MYKGFAGILTAILVVLAYLPLNVQAASAVPAISFVADWYNTDNGTYIILTNKGTLGTGATPYADRGSRHGLRYAGCGFFLLSLLQAGNREKSRKQDSFCDR